MRYMTSSSSSRALALATGRRSGSQASAAFCYLRACTRTDVHALKHVTWTKEGSREMFESTSGTNSEVLRIFHGAPE